MVICGRTYFSIYVAASYSNILIYHWCNDVECTHLSWPITKGAVWVLPEHEHRLGDGVGSGRTVPIGRRVHTRNRPLATIGTKR